MRYPLGPVVLASLLTWSRNFAHCFSLDLFNIVFDTTSQEEFAGDEHSFNAAVEWHTLRISASSAAAPFVGCTDYARGRRVRVRLERMLGVDAVRTVHHSREHGASCFLFHAHAEEATQLLLEDGGESDIRMEYLAAFPANLKVIAFLHTL